MDNEKETVMTDEKEAVQEDNRERIYESDLTPKEKRALEIEKLKAMTFRQKAGYIWEYYKIMLVVIIAFVVMGYIGAVVFRNVQQKELVSVTVVDAVFGIETVVSDLESDLLKVLGTGDEKEMVTIDTGASSGSGYAAVMKMNVVMSENGTDILICNADIYKEYEEEGAFKDWKEILGDDYAKYEPYMEDGKISLDASGKWKSYQMVSYSPVYIGVTIDSDKEEEAKRLVQFFLDE